MVENPSTTNFQKALILSLLVGSSLVAGSIALSGGHLTYFGHSSSLQNATGIICLTNQTSTCGSIASPLRTAGNFTSDANALAGVPIVNHNCATYFVTGNSTFRDICNFNGVVHRLGNST